MITKTKINSETTKNITEKQLDELVYNKAVDKYLGTFGEHFKNNEEDKLLCQMFACAVLDAEVINGGFDQFFLNSEDLAEFALDGLQKIEAEGHYQLLLLATKLYKEQKEEFKDKRNPNLSDLDIQYYKLEDISIKRQKFVKENAERFYD